MAGRGSEQTGKMKAADARATSQRLERQMLGEIRFHELECAP
jgi:hypothetical protein